MAKIEKEDTVLFIHVIISGFWLHRIVVDYSTFQQASSMSSIEVTFIFQLALYIPQHSNSEQDWLMHNRRVIERRNGHI